MRIVGIIIAVIGLLGAAINHYDIIHMGGALGNVRNWGIVVAVGVAVFFLFRRPSD
jgi:hypothetical protein